MKKAYSEGLSRELAAEVADGLRRVGLARTEPGPGHPGERVFQGGLGSKKVDVSLADERHGLLVAVSIKTICFAPFGKNLTNRFGDLFAEAITLHMRFPYSVVCALFVMPEAAGVDVGARRTVSTFARAIRLLGTISGRADHTSPGEMFEDVTLMQFRPRRESENEVLARLHASGSGEPLTEQGYFSRLRDLFNLRNPHAQVGIPETENAE